MKVPAVVAASEPSSILAWVLIIPALSIILTLVIPGIVAHSGSVFYRADLIEKLPATVQEAYAADQDTRQMIERQIQAIDVALENPSTVSPQVISSYVSLRGSLSDRLRSASSTVSPIPFYLNPQMLLWPAIYTCLGWLVTVFRPLKDWSLLRTRKVALLSLSAFAYAVYEWPLWARNFLLHNDGRTVYAYPNVDIHVASFATQELVILGFCILVVSLWLHWCEAFKRTLLDVRRASVDSFGYVISPKNLGWPKQGILELADVLSCFGSWISLLHKLLLGTCCKVS